MTAVFPVNPGPGNELNWLATAGFYLGYRSSEM